MKQLIILLFIIEFIHASITNEEEEAVPNQRITLGHTAEPGMFPYMVSIHIKKSHGCGGSIISTRWVLTAAHCCVFGNGSYMPDHYYELVVGSLFWNEGERYEVAKKVIHPYFRNAEYLNDVALLKSVLKFHLGPYVKPIKLKMTEVSDSTKKILCVVSGWGNTVTGGHTSTEPSDQLQYVRLSTIPLKNCTKSYASMTKRQICVFAGDGRGSCNADSGSPLVADNLQIGLVSFGTSCNNTKPEVYTRVSAYYTWIRKNMKNKHVQIF